MKEIIFKIDAEGEIQMEVQGVVGSKCDDFTAPFEKSLGVVAKKELKPQYFESEDELNATQESQGKNNG